MHVSKEEDCRPSSVYKCGMLTTANGFDVENVGYTVAHSWIRRGQRGVYCRPLLADRGEEALNGEILVNC